MAEDKKKETKETGMRISVKAKEKLKKTALAAAEREAKKAGAAALKVKKEEKTDLSRPAIKEISGEAWDTLKFVLMTEKCVRMIEGNNVLVFIADRKAGKKQIQDAFEKAFGSAVSSVRTVIDQDGRKKAYIRLKEAGAAGDIAIRLGII